MNDGKFEGLQHPYINLILLLFLVNDSHENVSICTFGSLVWNETFIAPDRNFTDISVLQDMQRLRIQNEELTLKNHEYKSKLDKQSVQMKTVKLKFQKQLQEMESQVKVGKKTSLLSYIWLTIVGDRSGS